VDLFRASSVTIERHVKIRAEATPFDPRYRVYFELRERHRTVYVIYGITLDGHKETLGLYLGEAEGAKFWLYVLTELKNRGLDDILILCADGLKGLPEAVEATFPKAIFQACIVHMTRHSLSFQEKLTA